jgi:hypothetical protein
VGRYVAAEIVPGKEHAMAIYYQVRTKVLSFVGKAIGLRASRPGANRKPARRR